MITIQLIDYNSEKPLFASHKLFIDLAVAELEKRELVEKRGNEYFFI